MVIIPQIGLRLNPLGSFLNLDQIRNFYSLFHSGQIAVSPASEPKKGTMLCCLPETASIPLLLEFRKDSLS
jgi:hypothetical protein